MNGFITGLAYGIGVLIAMFGGVMFTMVAFVWALFLVWHLVLVFLGLALLSQIVGYALMRYAILNERYY